MLSLFTHFLKSLSCWSNPNNLNEEIDLRRYRQARYNDPQKRYHTTSEGTTKSWEPNENRYVMVDFVKRISHLKVDDKTRKRAAKAQTLAKEPATESTHSSTRNMAHTTTLATATASVIAACSSPRHNYADNRDDDELLSAIDDSSDLSSANLFDDDMMHSHDDLTQTSITNINPCTGLPEIDNSGIDVGGNVMYTCSGTFDDSTSHDTFSDSSFDSDDYASDFGSDSCFSDSSSSFDDICSNWD